MYWKETRSTFKFNICNIGDNEIILQSCWIGIRFVSEHHEFSPNDISIKLWNGSNSLLLPSNASQIAVIPTSVKSLFVKLIETSDVLEENNFFKAGKIMNKTLSPI